MNKIITLLGKKMILSVAIVTIVVGGAIYIGASRTETLPASESSAEEKTSKLAVGGGDSNDVNTQWNDAVGGTKSMPENWPKDAPRAYSGALLLVSVTKNLGTGKQDPSVNYFTDASPVEVTDYYVKGLDENGWKIEANADSPAGYRVITAKKDTRSFFAFISIVQVEGKTGVTSGVNF